MSRSIAGKVIVITGAARGIGLSTARALLREGARLALCDIDEVALKAAVADMPDGVVTERVDVTDEAAFSDFLDRAERELGPLDVIVNNAGIMPVGRLDLEPLSVTKRTLDVNVLGVINGSKLALQRMSDGHQGHIINIASVAGESAVGGMATYHASKWAALGFTLSLAEETRDQGIDVTAILPAFVDTELTAGTKGMRFVPKVSVTEVADAIVSAVRNPREKVYVPRVIEAVAFVTRPLPRFVQVRIQRLLLPTGSMLAGLDHAARAAYDERIGMR